MVQGLNLLQVEVKVYDSEAIGNEAWIDQVRVKAKIASVNEENPFGEP